MSTLCYAAAINADEAEEIMFENKDDDTIVIYSTTENNESLLRVRRGLDYVIQINGKKLEKFKWMGTKNIPELNKDTLSLSFDHAISGECKLTIKTENNMILFETENNCFYRAFEIENGGGALIHLSENGNVAHLAGSFNLLLEMTKFEPFWRHVQPHKPFFLTGHVAVDLIHLLIKGQEYNKKLQKTALLQEEEKDSNLKNKPKPIVWC